MLMVMLPELIVIATAFLILILDLIFMGSKFRWQMPLAMFGCAIAAGACLPYLGQHAAALGGRFVMDQMAVWFKLIFLLAAFLVLSFSSDSFSPESKQKLSHASEWVCVLLFTLSGMMFLVSSRDLVSLYVSLELATVPLFALTAWRRNARGGEGAIKYLALGALASALLLYGFGLLYGLSGSTSLAAIGSAIHTSPIVIFAAILVLAGFGFKLTLVPFHMWAPDAYQAAPITITAYLSAASKAAGLGVAFLVFYLVFGKLLNDWILAVALVSGLTMTLGNVVAILQDNLKRFMAYSAISQAGYLIMGFLGASSQGMTAMIFYMLVYVLTNLVVFTVLTLHINQTGDEGINSLRGLSQRNPGLALAMMVGLFGLAGIPPLSGFVGKFFLFSVAAQMGLYWLVALAAINSTVSLYYYLRIVRQMYIEADTPEAKPLRINSLAVSGLLLATFGSVVCGILPYFYERIGTDVQSWLTLFTK